MDRQKTIKLSFAFLLLLGASSSFGLKPLESLILGDFSKNDEQDNLDPLTYIFQAGGDENTKDSPFQTQMAYYRGFYEEGKNLDNLCAENQRVVFRAPFERVQTTRVMLSGLQFIGLDILSRALPSYAKSLNFDSEEFENYVNSITGNYCSQNLTLISHRQLKKSLMNFFNRDEDFALPSFENNPLFAKGVKKNSNKEELLEKEFYYSTQLFKSLCSWGGDIDNVRLMAPLVQHPGIMAFVIRKLSGLEFEWQKNENRLSLIESNKTPRVVCENLICRQSSAKDFRTKVALAIGTNNYKESFERLYCQSLRDKQFSSRNQPPKIRSLAKELDEDGQKLMSAQMVSLLTGIPDLLVRADNFSDGIEFSRASIDGSWDNWANFQNKNLSQNLYYEEPLQIELVERRLMFNAFDRNFKIVFDVNLGEFDRINQSVGKLKTYFNIRMSKRFLIWARREWSELDPRLKDKKKDLVDRFKKMIEGDLQRARDRIALPNWQGDIGTIIAEELMDQMSNFRGKFYASNETGFVTIPIVFRYGPFALKYMNFLHQVKKSLEEDTDSSIANAPQK